MNSVGRLALVLLGNTALTVNDEIRGSSVYGACEFCLVDNVVAVFSLNLRPTDHKLSRYEFTFLNSIQFNHLAEHYRALLLLPTLTPRFL